MSNYGTIAARGAFAQISFCHCDTSSHSHTALPTFCVPDVKSPFILLLGQFPSAPFGGSGVIVLGPLALVCVRLTLTDPKKNAVHNHRENSYRVVTSAREVW